MTWHWYYWIPLALVLAVPLMALGYLWRMLSEDPERARRETIEGE